MAYEDTIKNRIGRLYTIAQKADDAYAAELRRQFGKKAVEYRYSGHKFHDAKTKAARDRKLRADDALGKTFEASRSPAEKRSEHRRARTLKAQSFLAKERGKFLSRPNPPRASKSSANEHNVRELFLYITNDSDLYRQRVGPIVKNLRLKVKKGKYDHELAIKIYQYLADDGARKYMKEYGTTGDRVDSIFTKVDRTQCAKELRDYYDDEVRG